LKNKKDKIFHTLKFIFPLLLLIIAIIEIKKFTGDLNISLLKSELHQLTIGSLLLIFLITITAMLPMLLYDVILAWVIKIKVSTSELLEQSFIANSFSNLIGLGGLVGAMLRTYFFHRFEGEKRRLIGVIAAVSLFYLTGIAVLSWGVVAGYQHFPLFVDTKWLYFAVLGVGLYFPVFIIIHVINSKKENKSLIPFKAGAGLIVVSLIEWFSVFLAIFFLSRILGISVSLENLFPIYIASACAGIISMIPGGLGSFDLVFIWGMQDLHIPEEKVLVLLLFYRVGYYFVPFLISLVLFVKLYWQKWNKSWNDLPKAIIQGASHIILTILIFLSGLILLLSASVPGIMSRLRIAKEILSFPIINVSHQLSVAAGFLLLGLSRGIEYRVKRTYDLTMFALILAALFSIFKGIEYEEAIFLIIVALVLKLSKGHFYRESYVLTWGKTMFDVSIILVITSMYLLIGYMNLPSAKMEMPRQLVPYVIIDPSDLFTSALIGLIIAFLILTLGYFVSLPKKWKLEPSLHQEQEIIYHLNKYKGKMLSHLILLHDKYVYWNDKRNILICFQKYADKLVILGDPIGEEQDLSNAIEEFQEKADRYGFTLVFYQVSDEMMSLLHNQGFAFFKLGEEASVDLADFSIQDATTSINEYLCQENYSFEVLEPPFTNELFQELRALSNEWLQGSKEKGFSTGYFDENYLNKAPIAVVRDDKKQLNAFMSMMNTYDENQTIAADLIRFRPGTEANLVDYLFISVMIWAKKQGYSHFNLGMAPLANVGLSRFAFLSEKIAAQIFIHGHFLYHFQGLRKFKGKYTNLWEPKYLAYRRKSSLPIIMAQISLLLSKRT